VLYVTNRAVSGTRRRVEDYSKSVARRDVSLGTSIVAIPCDHRIGTLESASIFRFQFHNDPRKHITVLSVAPQKSDQFFKELSSRVASSHGREVLVFIHGFNVSFEDSLRRTAQLAYDLKFEGVPIAFSWPSRSIGISKPQTATAVLSPVAGVALIVASARTEYAAAGENADETVISLREFLNEVRKRSGATTIHLIAHSMGARVLAKALSEIREPRRSSREALLREIILAAPDISVELFKSLAEGFRLKANRITLYASSKDRALILSKLISDHPRAGETGADIVVIEGIDTIDVSAVDTELAGHFYYGDNRSVVSDIFQLIRSGSPPGERFGLIQVLAPAGRYWLFRP
jgi:esterase/lipase superfamily enzyme